VQDMCAAWMHLSNLYWGLSFARGLYQQSLCGIVSSERWLTLLQSPSPCLALMHERAWT